MSQTNHNNNDPIKILPNETITSIFELLNTAAVTRSEAVSKAWRSQLLTDTQVHRILDLTTDQYISPEVSKFKDKAEMLELIQRLGSK